MTRDPMGSNTTILSILGESNRLQLGPFIRGKGIPVPCYPDIRRILGNPQHLRAVAKECAAAMEHWKPPHLLLGCSMVGVTLATAISIATGIPMIIPRVRNRPQWIPIVDVGYRRGQRVALIDDVILTGTTHQQWAKTLRDAGFRPTHFLSLLDVNLGAQWTKPRKRLEKSGVAITSLATWHDWALYMRDAQRIAPRVADAMLRAMEDAPQWLKEESS